MTVEGSDVTVFRTSSDFTIWTRMDAKIADGVARFDATEGGVYIAVSNTNVGMIVGIVVAVLLLVGVIVGGTVLYFKRHPDKGQAIKRSCQRQV